MKKIILLLVLFVFTNSFVVQENAYTTGEWFKLRIHYGMVNAGYATLEIKDAVKNNKKVHHVVGKGWTVGMTKFFFEVDDNYESYFDKQTGKPYQFVRKIDEGGYTKNQEGFFNQEKNTVLVKDYKHKTEKTFSVPEDVQDIVSSFYYLRNHPKIDKLKVGESIAIDMFFDDETTKFKLKFIGREDIKTKFGKVSCMVFRPYVQAGRVFKEEESLTVWISDDDNKIPIRLKASLAVGSLKADLEAFKGLKHSFKVKVEKIMEVTPKIQEQLDQLHEKFEAINQNTSTHLEGLLWAKPITYWDYIQTDALLSLQTQRTTLPDEMVFVMYHQVNELLFKMILWEMNQLCHNEKPSTAYFTEKLGRISRYFDMLTTSFDIMKDGMEPEQYLKFRNTLTPASGFQSAQYRLIEFSSTDLINLIDYRFRATIDRNTPYEHAFEHLYWQAAGKDYHTGEKSYLILEFERKYKKVFLDWMEEYNTINLWRKFKQLPEADQQNPELVAAMRHYDKTVNITWVMGHFNAAKKYIESVPGNHEATGGSNWKKYMLPKYQKRIFFPELWTKEELDNWGE